MTQSDLTPWVGSDKANEAEETERELPGQDRECPECNGTMTRRARTMHDYRPYECEDCEKRQ